MFEDASKIREANSNDGKFININRREHEKIMIDRFMCNAHLYLSNLPKEDDILSWLSLMQHYGAPTRLLDFTFSPYIALFFALEAGVSDAAVYCINHHAFKTEDDEYFGKDRRKVISRILDGVSIDSPFLFAFEPTFSNQRLLSQQGLLLATNTLLFTHEEIISQYQIEDADSEDTNVLKFIIPSKLNLSGLRKLNQMNINSTNIYPGLEGFCKSMRRQPVFGLEWQKRVN